MGIVYHRRQAVKGALGLLLQQNQIVVVVEPVGSVGNSRSEFSKRLW